jgi:hypothetical protein
MRGAMLTNAPLYRCLSKLLATCELFAENVARVLTSAPLSADDFPDAQGSTAYRKRQARIQVASESLHRLISAKDNNYAVMLKQFSEQFDKRVLELMTLLLQQSYVLLSDELNLKSVSLTTHLFLSTGSNRTQTICLRAWTLMDSMRLVFASKGEHLSLSPLNQLGEKRVGVREWFVSLCVKVFPRSVNKIVQD